MPLVLWKKRPHVKGGNIFDWQQEGEDQDASMEESATHHPHEPAMVARRLIALRAALGMNKAAFADMIGLDRSSYTKIEKGEKPLLPPSAYRIYQLFGVDMNFIYLGQVGGLPVKLSSAVMSHLNGTIS
jgi:DNA-binding XRE family transcriptional regulator